MARRDLSGAVDFSVLEAMTGGDAAISEEILALFVEQAALWSPMLEAKGEGRRDAAHTLRGAAAGIGAGTLAEACLALEQSDDTLAPAHIDHVRDALQNALADIAAYRHELMLRGLRG